MDIPTNELKYKDASMLSGYGKDDAKLDQIIPPIARSHEWINTVTRDDNNNVVRIVCIRKV